MHDTIDHRQHFRSLDGLRGIAILMVFLFHRYPRHPHDPISLLSGGGWTGVELFFVLSGFLITGILYDTLQQRDYFLNFYARRALRLMPVYILTAAIVLAIGRWFGLIYTWWDVPFLLYASNIVEDIGHHPQFGGLNLYHLWSLAVEEQFYFLWAPAVFLLRTRRRILIVCLCGAAFSIVLRWALVLYPVSHYAPYRELPTRLDGLMCGAALALILRTESGARWLVAHQRTLNAVCIAATVIFCLCIAVAHSSFYSSPAMQSFGYPAAVALFGAILALALQPGTWPSRLGQLTPLRSLGKYSYGFYLFHQIPMKSYDDVVQWAAGLTRFTLLGEIAGVVIIFAITLVAAVLSYHTLEKSFLRMKRFFAYDDETSGRPAASAAPVRALEVNPS